MAPILLPIHKPFKLSYSPTVPLCTYDFGGALQFDYHYYYFDNNITLERASCELKQRFQIHPRVSFKSSSFEFEVELVDRAIEADSLQFILVPTLKPNVDQ